MIGYGADADELDRIAGELGRAAHVLDARRATLNTHIHHAPWAGTEADRFRQIWHQRHSRTLVAAAAFLHAAQSELAKNAHQQRVASAAAGGAIRHSAYRTLAGGLTTSQFDALAAIAAGLAGQLHDMRGRTAAEQLAWWNSLTDEQRRALLTARPGELTALSGLPADVLWQAREEYLSSIADQVKVRSTSVEAEVSVSVKLIEIGIELDAEQTTFRDGHVEIDIGAAISAGASVEVAELARKQGVSGVYSFANQHEADQFLARMRAELKPSATEVLLHGTSAPIASVLGFLVSQRDHLASATVSGGVTASAEAKGVGASAKVSQESGLSATVDTQGDGKGDVTLKASTSVSSENSLGSIGATGKVELSAALTMHGAQATQLTFTQSYEGAALAGLFTPVAEAAVGDLAAGTMEITFDLTDPLVKSAADQAASAMERGDVSGAAAAMNGVLDRAQIVVQQEVGVTATSSFDAKVASGSVTIDASTVTSTFIKPPGGAFYEVK